MEMRRGLYVAGVVAALVFGAVGIGMGGQGGVLTVAPTTVNPGQSVTLTGTGCDASSFEAEFTYVNWRITGPDSLEGPVVDNGTVNPVPEGGTWMATHTTASNAALGTYYAHAECFEGSDKAPSFQGQQPRFTYNPAPFQVVQPSPSPSPSVSPTPTPTQEPVEEEEPEAKPAKAVRAQPTFTG